MLGVGGGGWEWGRGMRSLLVEKFIKFFSGFQVSVSRRSFDGTLGGTSFTGYPLFHLYNKLLRCCLVAQMVKNPSVNARDPGWIPG